MNIILYDDSRFVQRAYSISLYTLWVSPLSVGRRAQMRFNYMTRRARVIIILYIIILFYMEMYNIQTNNRYERANEQEKDIKDKNNNNNNNNKKNKTRA